MAATFPLHLTLHPILFYILEQTVIVLTISFTPASSLLRPALLPILILAVYYTILYCRTVFYRDTWAGFTGGTIIVLLLHYVEIALISKWDFNAQGPTASPSTDHVAETQLKPPVSSASSPPLQNEVFARLRFGYLVTTSDRNIGTPYMVKNVPAFSAHDPSYVPTRNQFLSWRLFTIVATFLFIDLLQTQTPSQTPEQYALQYSSDAMHIFTGNPLTISSALTRLIEVLVSWFCTVIIIDAFTNIFAVPSVLLHLKPVSAYRPNFGPVAEAYTVRGFWGCFWHQLLRKQLSGPADVIVYRVLGLTKGRLVARYVHLFLVFLISGLLHMWIDVGEGYLVKDSGSLHFFLTQAGGIMLEDAVQALYRSWSGLRREKETTRARRLIGWIWVVAFLWWSTPCWFYPRLRQGKGDERSKILPVSVVAWMLRR